MKIVVKQTDELKGTAHPFKDSKVVNEYLVYLMGENNRPLSCEVVYGVAAKNDFIHSLLVEHFIPEDWENNKSSFDVSKIVEEVSFNEYLNAE
jgi:hypothetical protein